MSRLTITLLGEAYAAIDGVEIQVDTRKAIALLAWLAVTGREHRREALAALFWPDADDARARAALRRTLSTLSGALGGRWLVATRERVGLDGDGIDLDVDRFQRLLVTSGAGEWGALEQAVDIYHGDFMAGFSLRDSPDFDDWQRDQAEALRGAFGRALDQLIEMAGDAGKWTEAIRHARRRLALDPLHEDAHRRLMRLYAWADDRSAALRQYRECIRILDQELGVAPLDETTALYQAIQEQRLAPAPTVTAAPDTIPSRDTSTARGSSDGYPLVGRSRELALILDSWAAIGPDGRIIAVEGEAGIGKTRMIDAVLAEASIRRRRTLCLRCYEGETQLAFGPIIEGLQVALSQPAMAEAISQLPREQAAELTRLVPRIGSHDVQQPTTPLDSPGAQARFFNAIAAGFHAALHDDGPGLLIIEDAHWIDDASLDLLGYLVRRLGGHPLLIVVTWRAEQVPSDHRLRQIVTGAVRAGTGRRLSLERLTAEHMQLLADETAHDLGVEPGILGARLFRETEGLPFFAVEYLSELRFRTLPDSDENWPLPEGPRSLLKLRIASLSATEAQLLTTLATVGRSASYELLREASGRSEEEIVSALDGLLDHGIVVEREGEDDAHEPVYEIRHDKLREVAYGEMSLTRRRLLHRRIAAALGRQARSGMAATQIAQHLRLAGQDREAADAYRDAADAAAALYATSEALGHYQTALALGHPDAPALHERIGDLWTLRGDYERAKAAFETAAALQPETARIEHKLGNLYQRMGAWALASHHYGAAKRLFRPDTATGSTGQIAQLYADWSLTELRKGDIERAEEFGRDAHDLAEATGDDHALAQSENLLGILARTTGDLAIARQHFETALALAIRLGDHGIQTAALNNLSRVVHSEGDNNEALALAREALELSATHGDRHHEAALHSNLADLLHATGLTVAAQEHLRSSAMIYAEIGVVAGEFQPEIWKLSEW